MKNIHRLPNTPHHQTYNLLEHSFIVGVLFKWFASAENVPYSMPVFEKVLLHDFVESVTGDLNALVKHLNPTTSEAWKTIEREICDKDITLRPYSDENIENSMTQGQYRLFKMCDYLELWIFCKNEIALGNTSNKIMLCLQNCEKLLDKCSDGWKQFKSIKQFMQQYEP